MFYPTNDFAGNIVFFFLKLKASTVSIDLYCFFLERFE